MCDKATNVHGVPVIFSNSKQDVTASEIAAYLEKLRELTGGKN